MRVVTRHAYRSWKSRLLSVAVMCTALQANGICGEDPFEVPLQGLDGACRHQCHGPRVFLVRRGESSQQGMVMHKCKAPKVSR